MKYGVLLFVFAFSTVTAFGQVRDDSFRFDTSRKTLHRADLDKLPSYKYADSYPLTRDTSGTYPGAITAKGKIVAVTPGVPCGVYCGCGTIKIELTQKIKRYHHRYVFAAIPCFNIQAADYLYKTITIKLVLLRKNNKSCFWQASLMNSIDSKGIPFYIPENLDEKLDIR